jgi:hypothetical protein
LRPRLVDRRKGVVDVEGEVLPVALGVAQAVDDLDHPRLSWRLAHVGERAAQRLRGRPILVPHLITENVDIDCG